MHVACWPLHFAHLPCLPARLLRAACCLLPVAACTCTCTLLIAMLPCPVRHVVSACSQRWPVVAGCCSRASVTASKWQRCRRALKALIFTQMQSCARTHTRDRTRPPERTHSPRARASLACAQTLRPTGGAKPGGRAGGPPRCALRYARLCTGTGLRPSTLPTSARGLGLTPCHICTTDWAAALPCHIHISHPARSL